MRNNLKIRVQGSKGGEKPKKAVEAPDSLFSISHARIIDLISEGEIEGFVHGNDFLRDVYLDETPIQNEDGSRNFKNLQVDARTGTQTQTHIAGFPAVENELGVNVELLYTTPWTRSFTNKQLSAVRIRIGTPAFTSADTESGDVNGSRVEYAIDVATDGGAFNEVMRSAMSGKSSGPYERGHRVELPTSTVSGWIVRVRRLTPDSATQYVANETNIISVTEIIDGKFRYPMSAVVGIQVDSSQFQSIPSRGYHVKGRLIKVPANYDPVARTYATTGIGTSGGTWDGTFKVVYSNNPAWVYYDMATHKRYGLGRLVDELIIDKWALYSIAQYCDELVSDGFGGMEPRMTCNLYLQRAADAWKVIGDLSSVFRGISYWAGGSIVPVCDRPSDPVYTYTNANVAGGMFRYESSSRRARHTAVFVSYTDMSDFGRLKTDYYDDPEGIARFGFQPTEIVAIGCTSRGQAQRFAKWILYSEKILTNLVSFATGPEGTYGAPGQIVRIADKYRAGRRIGGRVSSATTTHVVLDALPTPAPMLGDTLIATLPSGIVQSRTVSSVVGNGINVSSPFTEAPQAESVWAIESTDLSTQLFRLLSVKNNEEDATHSMIAMQHNPSIFDAIDFGDAIVIPDSTDLVPPSSQFRVGPITITSVERAGQVLASTLLTASWEPAPKAVRYQIQWQKDDGQWTSPQIVNGTTADYPNAFPGVYLAKVHAFNALNIVSIPTVSDPYTLSDQILVPGVIEDLTTGQEVLEQIGLDNQAAIAQEIIDRLALEADLAVTNAQLAVVQGQVGDILQADEWVLENEYIDGDLVQSAGVLYRALQNVPANTPITDTLYWEAIGNYASLGEAVWAIAAQATATETAVTELDGEVTALTTTVTQQGVEIADKADASAVDLLTTRVTDAEGDIDANSAAITSLTSTVAGKADTSALNALTTRVTTAEGNITSNANNITSLTATVAGKADTSALNALDARVTTAEGDITANSSSITTLNARVPDSSDNLVKKSIFEDGARGGWTGGTVSTVSSHPTLTQALAATGDVALGAPTLHDYHFIATPGDVFDYSADLNTQLMSAGLASFRIQWLDAAGVSVGFSPPASRAAGLAGFATVSSAAGQVAPAGTAYGRAYLDFTTGPEAFYATNMKITRRSADSIANSTAVNALEARVTSVEGVNTAQASSITSLTADVGTANASITSLYQVTASAAVGNALVNPGFEDGDDHWVMSANAAATLHASARSGGGLLVITGAASPGAAQSSDYIPIKVGQTVRFGMYVRRWTTVIGPVGSWCRINVRWFDKNKTTLSYLATDCSTTTTSTSFQKVIGSAVAPAGAAYCSITITTNATSGNWGVDDVTVEPLTDMAANAFASAGLTLDVNGYISGYRTTNDGTTSNFSIVADQFQVISPGGGARTEFGSGNWRVYDAAGQIRVRLGVW